MDDHKVIIGKKDIATYLGSIMLEFEKTEEIVLSSVIDFGGKIERIINILSLFGIKEVRRDSDTYNSPIRGNVKVILYYLKRPHLTQ